MNAKPHICRRPSEAVEFWRGQVALTDAATSTEKNFFWIITLNQKRELTRVFEPATKAFGNSQRFSDEVFSEPFLRYAKYLILIHYRPGVAPAPVPDDVQRVRALILAGREKDPALLDAIVVGLVSEKHPAGCFSFRQLPGFDATVPFEGKAKAP